MKRSLAIVLLVSALVGVSQAHPNPGLGVRSIDDDVNTHPLSSDSHPLEHLDDSTPVKELQFNPFAYTPLATFIQSMQAMMRKVQLHMGEVLRGMPPQEIDWGKLGKTTSHTKVVNGHTVTVNETTYSNKDMPSDAVLHIRVVDVKPTENHEEDSSAPPHNQIDKESSDRIKPVVPQTRVINENYFYTIPEEKYRIERQPSTENEIDYAESLNDVDNSVELFESLHPIDLSGDTRVNNLMSDKVKKGGLVMIDPDAELIDVVDGEVRKTYYPYQSSYDYQHPEEIFP